MKCESARKRLAGMSLGVLSGPEQRQVQAHVADCAACRGELERMRTAERALSSALEDERPVDLTTRVLARLDRPASPARLGWWLPVAAGAAVLAAVLVVPWTRGPEPLSTSEVMQAYGEDLNALSLWGTATTSESEEPTWGIPTELAQWINN
ncbi:MAG: zf-HC2 domain-containing protein [candidate division FCPU426 bacterium]